MQDSQAREAAARSAQAREEERSKAAAERERARLEAERKARVQPAIDAAEEAARQARQNSSTTGEEDEAARLAWALRQSRLPPELQDQRYINVDDVPEDQDEEIFDQDWEESAIDPPAIHQRYKAEGKEEIKDMNTFWELIWHYQKDNKKGKERIIWFKRKNHRNMNT